MPETAEMQETATQAAEPQTGSAAGSSGGGAQGSPGTQAQTPGAATQSQTQGPGSGASAGSSGLERSGREGGRGSLSRGGAGGLAPWMNTPFGLMRLFADEMDRFFEDFGFGGRRQARGLERSGGAGTGSSFWRPQIEVSQREGNLVVCADLPGLSKDDVHVEVRDDQLVLEGERRSEREERQEGGLFRSERSYGRFYRAIPLPEGTDPDQAKASFKDGVLEVTLPLPESRSRSRRIEIQGGGSPGAGGSSPTR